MTRSIPFHNVDENQTCDKEAEVDEYKITENTPYISSIDVEDEILTIFNPSPKSVNLSHYYVKDDKDLHQLTFPEGTEIESKGVLYIYTCPGAHKGAFENPNILWRNMDGSLRRKEVLNNDYCKMILCAPNGNELGSCLGGKEVEPKTPYISFMDVEEEWLTIANPSEDSIDLSGYFLQDLKALHRFYFPENTELPASGQLNLYTCPGNPDVPNHFTGDYVLWKNHDGSLRKKEVLNNERCTMLLFNPSGTCLASCSGGSGLKPVIGRRQEVIDRYQPPPSDNTREQLNIARFFCLVIMVGMALIESPYLSIFYWSALLLDLLSREEMFPVAEDPGSVHRWQHLGDKLNVMTLYCLLAKEVLSMGLMDGHTILSDIIPVSHQQIALIVMIVAVGVEYAVLNAADHKDEHHNYIVKKRSFIYNHFNEYMGSNSVTIICLLSEIFMLMAYNSSLGLVTPLDFADPNATFVTKLMGGLSLLAVKTGFIAFILRQLNNLSIQVGGFFEASHHQH